MTKFSMRRDINGYNGFGLKFSDNNYSVNLATATEATLTIPESAQRWLAIFSYEPGSDVWVANNAAAAIPAGAAFSVTSSQGNPVAREVNGGDVLSLITDDDNTTVGVSLYELMP